MKRLRLLLSRFRKPRFTPDPRPGDDGQWPDMPHVRSDDPQTASEDETR